MHVAENCDLEVSLKRHEEWAQVWLVGMTQPEGTFPFPWLWSKVSAPALPQQQAGGETESRGSQQPYGGWRSDLAAELMVIHCLALDLGFPCTISCNLCHKTLKYYIYANYMCPLWCAYMCVYIYIYIISQCVYKIYVWYHIYHVLYLTI